jgi:hypothetical protein
MLANELTTEPHSSAYVHTNCEPKPRYAEQFVIQLPEIQATPGLQASAT